MRSPSFPLPVGAMLASAGVFFLMTGACTTLRPVGLGDLHGPDSPGKVRITEAGHSTAVLQAPQVTGDTLVGTVNGVPQHILLSQVTAIQEWEGEPDRTALLVFGGIVGGFALLVTETAHTGDLGAGPHSCVVNMPGSNAGC